MVTSRIVGRANSFSEAVGGYPIPFDSAPSTFNKLDLIFVSTTAPYPLVTFDKIDKAMSTRIKPMMILDLSNPRVVQQNISSINGVKLINIDQVAENCNEKCQTRNERNFI
jgi:glutamyl-tRNA reductase